MVAATPRALPLLLTFNGGYVDTAGFLAIQGLFTAHVTGNFVTIGAALVSGTSGVLTKLLALPVFCVVVLVCRLLSRRWERRKGASVLTRLLLLHFTLLVAGCVLAILVLPATATDEGPALTAGLLLVAAMAAQNGLHRTHLAGSPPSTLMTGTTTQIMVDLADLLGGSVAPEVTGRIRGMAVQVAIFACGCGVAAFAYDRAGRWCFALPPLVAAAAWLSQWREQGV